MEGEKNLTYENLRGDTIKEDNVYELCVLPVEERRPESPKIIRKKKELSWNKPVIMLTVLLLLLVILQVCILCLLLAHVSTTSTTTGTITAGTSSIVSSNCSEWATDIVNKVNNNLTQSLPNFNEWANVIVSKVNTNLTQSFPDLSEWANGVAQNTLELLQSNPNFTGLSEQILQTTRESAQNLVDILSNLQDTSASTAGVAVHTLLFIKQMYSQLTFPTSCKQILSEIPTSPSGHYILASTDGSTNYTAYCDMDELCGSGGGWTRLAYLDMSDPAQSCPSTLTLYQSGGVRACGKPVLNIGCVSVQFPSNGISYSQICGRVTGYQYRSTDAINTHINDLNSYYVDGISITRGSPRQHVWTLIAGKSESISSTQSCPCNSGNTVSVQSFIGNNYFCESGNPNSVASNILYSSDPLWDGQGCSNLETSCCNVTGIPWFHRDYGSNTTTDYIELRACADFDDEDSPVSYYEIYVK